MWLFYVLVAVVALVAVVGAVVWARSSAQENRPAAGAGDAVCALFSGAPTLAGDEYAFCGVHPAPEWLVYSNVRSAEDVSEPAAPILADVEFNECAAACRNAAECTAFEWQSDARTCALHARIPQGFVGAGNAGTVWGVDVDALG